MIKEWATVVSWENGQALVSCDVKASCSSCASRAGCGSRVLNKLGPQTTHTIVVPCDEPLVPGQKVELGIAEGSLLSSALLVYMSPLVGLFLIASLFQLLFASDVAALCAARAEWQPIILSVALPPGLVRFETSSEDASQ
ncbi:MAG TPA: SoxR-reducing system protein RseC [Escherichia coli]|nr:SoxR-reducing system protein RseC [Escherichia coli]